jgi:DNA-binding response OmpR family regulator
MLALTEYVMTNPECVSCSTIWISVYMAFENFKPYYYNLAILDSKMPQMNGFSFYREIKKLDTNLRICFLTAGEMYYVVYQIYFFLYPLTIHWKAYWQ